MNIEIRKSFTKDADKLHAAFQRQLSVIISSIEKSQPTVSIIQLQKNDRV